jgi:hypothetical protein
MIPQSQLYTQMNESTKKSVVLREGDNIIHDHYQIHDHDVLFGRGNRTFYHPGNGYYRDLISNQCEKYSRCSLRDKHDICKQIYDSIKAQHPPGKLLRECKNQIDHWEGVTEEDAIKKIGQAFRDKINIRAENHKELNLHNRIPSTEVSVEKLTHIVIGAFMVSHRYFSMHKNQHSLPNRMVHH